MRIKRHKNQNTLQHTWGDGQGAGFPPSRPLSPPSTLVSYPSPLRARKSFLFSFPPFPRFFLPSLSFSFPSSLTLTFLAPLSPTSLLPCLPSHTCWWNTSLLVCRNYIGSFVLVYCIVHPTWSIWFLFLPFIRSYATEEITYSYNHLKLQNCLSDIFWVH